jgi:hypothetical protein
MWNTVADFHEIVLASPQGSECSTSSTGDKKSGP